LLLFFLILDCYSFMLPDSPSLPHRIWYQSFLDSQQQGPYLERLRSTLAEFASSDVRFEVHSITPPVSFLGPLTEFRCARQIITNAIEAERQGYAAFVIGHFQEPGLTECRAAVNIPVIGLGEASMTSALSLGSRFGLITINPAFLAWHRDQVTLHGLSPRCAGIHAVNTDVEIYMRAFQEKESYDEIKSVYAAEASALKAKGCEVVIPAGGMPMLLFAKERHFIHEGIFLLNGIATIVAATEMAIKLHRLTGVTVSRCGKYAKASPEEILEFLHPG
jgi:allantoin racemase